VEDLVIVGAGPAGLAAAHAAVAAGAGVVVLEQLDRVGGLARTLTFRSSRFDIGPHRFYTRNREVDRLFRSVLGEDLVEVPRLTRILHGRRFFNYPLTPLNALRGVGPLRSAAILASYAAAQLRRRLSPREPVSFEDWVVDRFGRRLFATFFQSYTEKVWGLPCSQIGAAWAAQRIKGLSLAAAIRQSLLGRRAGGAKSLVESFAYPRLGAGQLYEKLAAGVVRAQGAVALGSRVVAIRREGARVRSVECLDAAGRRTLVEGRQFLLSAPLTEFVRMLRPAPPPAVLAACDALGYRHHIGVNLLVEGQPFPDNWIYVHAREVAMARVANYRNFSPAMAGDGLSPLTVEYFASAGDALWTAPDEALLARAARELRQLGLLPPEAIRGGFVVRSPQAYPLIDLASEGHVRTVKAWLDGLENLLPIGRSGMFKYNNQDHAMFTGLLAARHVLGLGPFDPWRVNIDAEYLEEAPAD